MQPVADPPVSGATPAGFADDADWLERICYGGDLPEAARGHLRRAALVYHRTAEAERHLKAAWDAAPGSVAVSIGLYRFYFYKGQLAEALKVAQDCLRRTAREGGLPDDWRRVRPHHAAFDTYDAAPRFYLFTLKAYGYIRMRLGHLDEGRAAVAKVMELDPADHLGGSVLMGVLDRVGRDDDD